MSAEQNAKDYFNQRSAGNMNGIRVCVPAYERMMQLYAFGHTSAQISEILQQEFADIDYNPMSASAIKKTIEMNQSEFQIARMNLGLKCRDKIQEQIAILFNATEDVELTMVSVYVNKLRDVLNQLADTDIGEQDDDGNYTQTSRFFVLLEMAEKLQGKVAKIVGTDALREIEVFRKKAEAKQQAESDKGSLLPRASGKVINENNKPAFI